MDGKDNSSNLVLCEANLSHPRSLTMGISIHNCCGGNGDGDTIGSIDGYRQSSSGANASNSNKSNEKKDVAVTVQKGEGGQQVGEDLSL